MNRLINLLWRMAAHTDNRIEPIPVGRNQFEQDDSGGIKFFTR